MTVQDLLQNGAPVLLDGGMGTEMQARGMAADEIPELLHLTNPMLVAGIHRDYAAAGAKLLYANTFGANRLKLAAHQTTPAAVIPAAISLARAAAGNTALVALDIGSIGQLLEPNGTLTFEEAYDMFAEQVEAGRDADVIAVETMTDLAETRAAVLAAVEHGGGKPVFCTMSFEENGRTFTGCPVAAMALTLAGLGVSALGINCSLGPMELLPLVEELAKWTTLPLIVKPNAGLPDPVTGKFGVGAEEFANDMLKIAQAGGRLLGGCCGTTPAHIAAMGRRLAGLNAPRLLPVVPAAVCSATRVVTLDQPRVIGERINPTGKKLFQAALRAGDMDYILGQAISQADAGADLLDINVGLPDLDEGAMMTRVVRAVQGITDRPLQLDSTDPAVLERALRACNGKPIINSVNGEEKSLAAILPLVKRYGAAVVGLTLDENGIPATADARFAIAERILNRALALGIPRENVCIDCLTLTVSAEQAGAQETLRALHRVKTELGLKTVLGVSNISFGLPNRALVNHSFLTMALTQGLDLPIMNPNLAVMMDAVRAHRLLMNYDTHSTDFVAVYGNAAPAQTAPAAPAELTLGEAVLRGLKGDAGRLTRALLADTGAMEIVNGHLIPALDRAGAQFEAGTLFLPQLIQAAGAAQAAFAEIRAALANSDAAPVFKGKIVLATVRGDVHDIGKNIVKVLLENYGYTVIDLGRDVPPEAILAATLEHEAPLVGLSALMTTTLGAMEETIALLHEKQVPCKVVVGGAVLTAEYAKKIAADFYARDAKETVDIAKQVIG